MNILYDIAITYGTDNKTRIIYQLLDQQQATFLAYTDSVTPDKPLFNNKSILCYFVNQQTVYLSDQIDQMCMLILGYTVTYDILPRGLKVQMRKHEINISSVIQ